MTRSGWLRASAVLFGALSFGLSGCVQSGDDVVVANDGSGSFTETVVFDVEKTQELGKKMAEMMKMFLPPTPPPPPDAGMEGGDKPPPPEKPPEDPYARMKARLGAIPGLEVTKDTVEIKDGKQRIALGANFKTLEAYAQATFIDAGTELVKNEDGSYTLKFEGRSAGRGGRRGGRGGMDEGGMGSGGGGGGEGGMEGEPPAMGGGEPPQGPGMGMMGGMLAGLEPYLADLELVRKVKLPGTIVETNGTKGEDGSITWKVTYEDLKSGKAGPQTVTFKGEGLDLKPFKVKRSARGTWLGGEGAPPRPPGGAPPPGPGPAMEDH